jgi:hypothetical protein
VTKKGRIVQVVPAKGRPCHLTGVYGAPRNHESYVVEVNGQPYWPRVKWLNKPNEAEELARAISHFVNLMGNRVEDVVERLSHEHRTIQQGITKLAVDWLEEMGRMHKEGDFDLRNQASAELGKAFMERITIQERSIPLY